MDGINAWIANVMDRVVMLLFEKVDFERKDGKKLIHIALDVLDAVFLPSPNLWRNVIINRYGSILVNKLGDFEVEARVRTSSVVRALDMCLRIKETKLQVQLIRGACLTQTPLFYYNL